MSTFIRLATLSALAILTGCTPNYSTYEGPTIAQIQAAKKADAKAIEDDGKNWVPHTLTEQQRRQVENALRGVLKDPDSALFGTMKAVIRNGEISICGLVNAKNSFGGYTGNQPFSAAILSKDPSAEAFIIAVGGSDHDPQVILTFCGNRGLFI